MLTASYGTVAERRWGRATPPAYPHPWPPTQPTARPRGRLRAAYTLQVAHLRPITAVATRLADAAWASQAPLLHRSNAIAVQGLAVLERTQ
jgi:hypothetical protein